MRELYKKDFSNGLPEQAFMKVPAPNIRRHKLNKRKFFVSLTLFTALIALAVIGI